MSADIPAEAHIRRRYDRNGLIAIASLPWGFPVKCYIAKSVLADTILAFVTPPVQSGDFGSGVTRGAGEYLDPEAEEERFRCTALRSWK